MTEVTRKQAMLMLDAIDKASSKIVTVYIRDYITQLEHKHADLVTRCEQAESEVDMLRKKVQP